MASAQIVIIGAGCFGISTAYHLLKRGFQDITIIERSNDFPAKDASSNDINRIVRTSYSDPFYAKLAKEAIQSWKEDVDIWGDSYHESGVLVLGASNEAYLNDIQQGSRLKVYGHSPSESSIIHESFSPNAIVSLSSDTAGYINYDGGWVDAGKATFLLTQKVKSLGAKLILGKRASRLMRKEGHTEAVECHDGTVIQASLLIIAAGPWSPSIFPELNYQHNSLATGQGIAMIQLSQEEASKYRDVPVVLNFSTGFYCFPPTEKDVVKIAIHAPGFTHTIDNVSIPRTVITHPEDGLLIPRNYAQRLRVEVAAVYPELAKKAFSSTRLCWYNDSPDSDWIIGRHPTDSSIMFATGGSGHAFKFFPVIGRIVADAIQGTLDPSLARKFAFNREITHVDHSRDGTGMLREELDVNQLYGPEDAI
ncbi:FAD dependent oxidoreductase [Lentinula aciculospora]|uniref:FAD dependent oxidoreductase n=1 Tax=Lentinula aciculospora TaxID=153920 RepID=A0A9W9AM31_9AGAR|nr:FAD dependent oxidoreductase [Lentinula aciculospora]